MTPKEKNTLKRALDILEKKRAEVYVTKILIHQPRAGNIDYDEWVTLAQACASVRSLLSWPTARTYDAKGNRA